MNKKVVTGLIIAAMVVIVGGVAYYFYNRASADAYAQAYCEGLTGASWRNCNQNISTWRKFLSQRTLSRFKKLTNYADELSD